MVTSSDRPYVYKCDYNGGIRKGYTMVNMVLMAAAVVVIVVVIVMAALLVLQW